MRLPGRQPAQLSTYVPRVAIEWLAEEPDARFRELAGTMAFVDISGFTQMSERLSSLGRAGAEEVTGVMNVTFTRLLDVAYDFGGGLVKFGGDALLLFFDGEEHAERAAAAAHGMRDALRELGPPQTSAGPVRLKMHVGLNTGRFHFFLVGESHLELIVTGPAATETVLMEATAEAGDILLSPSAAAALAPRLLGKTKGAGTLLRACPRIAPRPAPLSVGADIRLEHLVPVELRAHVASASLEAEHRTATVAFLHFGGVDALLEREGSSWLADALGELVTTIQKAASEHGVCFLESDIDADGGKIVLVAGAPRTWENDEERMLRTVRSVIEAPLALPLRVGVNRGRVFAGEVGGRLRRTYTILGDTAALAARLTARAEPGQVLAEASVLHQSLTSFDTRELEPFHVKGMAEPVRAVVVGPVVGTRKSREASRLELVGRERELAILGAALAPVQAGFGSFVELVGDAGIGKSRLLEEIQVQAAGMTILSAACEQYESSTPYFAFRGVLRTLVGEGLNGSAASNTAVLSTRVGEIAPELVPWVPLLALPLDVEVEPTREVEELQPAFRRARLHGVVTSLLHALLPTQAMFLFEDVHWMDEASSELLRHLGSNLSTRPWFACVTRRPVEGGFSPAQCTPPVPALTIRLDPLSQDAARRLAADAATRVLSSADLEAITERAGGNPLFLQELLAADTASEPEQLPASLEAVVASRIDALVPGDRALLRWASVFGASFAGDLLAAALGEEPNAFLESEVWDRLVEFVERDPDVAGAFRFRHALIRDAAYEGLPFRRREELHGQVGRAYEEHLGEAADDAAEILALHFSRARDDDNTWKYSLAAGDRARAKHANAEAATFYRLALKSAPRVVDLAPSEPARVWVALSDVCLRAGLLSEAGAALAKARRLFPSAAPEQLLLLLKEGHVREASGKYPDALRWYARARRSAHALPEGQKQTQTLVELALATAGVRYRQGDLADCVGWCKRALDEADAIGDLPNVAHAYYLLHLAYTSMASPEREAYRGIALPIYEELGDLGGQAKTLNNMGIDAYYEGRWDDALDCYRLSKELMDRIGDVLGAATLTNNIGEILSDQGRLEAAVELFEEVKRVTDAAGDPLLSAVARANLGRAAARAGQLEEAEELLRAAVGGFESIKAAGFVVETHARLAELAVIAGGQPEVALMRAEATLEQAREAGSTVALTAMLDRIRGYALLQTGHLPAALEALEASLVAARPAKVDYEIALTLNALAEAGASNADALAEESGRIFERLGVVSVPRVPLP